MEKILIVEDDISIQALLHDFIEEAGYETGAAYDGVEALAAVDAGRFDLDERDANAQVAGTLAREDENYDFLENTMSVSLSELYCERFGETCSRAVV